jgi:hypothetical protein
LSETRQPCALRPEKRAGDPKGELGIRHEDTVAVTADGCENLAPNWSGTPEEPAVV